MDRRILLIAVIVAVVVVGLTVVITAPSQPKIAPPDNNENQPIVATPCGNAQCDPGETCQTCPYDCKCTGATMCNISDSRADTVGCAPFCGNGVCDSREDMCNCRQDCNTCFGDLETCKEFYCNDSVCATRSTPMCCGNGICDSNENTCSCSTDCGACSGYAGPCQEYYCENLTCSIGFNTACPALYWCEGYYTVVKPSGPCGLNTVVMPLDCKKNTECLPPAEAYCNKGNVDSFKCSETYCKIRCNELPRTNDAPVLTNGKITADGVQTGSAGDYNFEVTYFDADFDPPAYVTATINGKAYGMSKIEPYCSYMTGGCKYTRKNSLSSGTYEVFFTASDGTETVKFPANGTMSISVV